ncbi:hypothetical protein [Leuconostoc suionicum]|uniref:hypothetical protein n=1 Tax=Leuconostoc suionicum TaxID=1511761 RepID=UPI0028D6DC21|nr:hypothetical protein [Leuconostoc suionicum]
MLDLDLSNRLDQSLRNQLISNFKIIDQAIDGGQGISQEQLDDALKGIRNIAYTINAGSDKGESSTEVQLMRTNINGHVFETAPERIDVLERAIKRLGGTLDV